MRTTAAPPSTRSRTIRQTARRLSGSSPVVGSSSTTTRGRPSSASARSSRRRSPPDRERTRTSARPVRSTCSSASRDRSRVGQRAGPGLHGLAHGQVSRESAVLQQHAQVPANGAPVAPRVVPEDPHAPTGRRGQPLEHLQCRGLACAVDAEQREHLPGVGPRRRCRGQPGSRRTGAPDRPLRWRELQPSGSARPWGRYRCLARWPPRSMRPDPPPSGRSSSDAPLTLPPPAARHMCQPSRPSPAEPRLIRELCQGSAGQQS